MKRFYHEMDSLDFVDEICPIEALFMLNTSERVHLAEESTLRHRPDNLLSVNLSVPDFDCIEEYNARFDPCL